jgi:hypothetical protein
VLAQRAGDLLHGYGGAHGLTAPLVEELAGPRGRVVILELLKNLFEEVSSDGLQVLGEQIAETKALFVCEVLFPLE